jgi:hypothetical protein
MHMAAADRSRSTGKVRCAADRSCSSGKVRCAAAWETMGPVVEAVPITIVITITITITMRAETPEGYADAVVSRSVPQIAVVVRGVAARIV